MEQSLTNMLSLVNLSSMSSQANYNRQNITNDQFIKENMIFNRS